jgi:nitrogen fixation protein NifU and related proteins
VSIRSKYALRTTQYAQRTTHNAMDITKLYQDFILKRSQDDTHFEKRLAAQHTLEAYNPLCGDKFKLFLDVENEVISKATFHGYGCAISKAATSVLMEKIQQKSYLEALDLIKSYFQVLDIENLESSIEENHQNTEGVTKKTKFPILDEDIRAFQVMQQFPERMTCATLSWQAAYEFLNEKII